MYIFLEIYVYIFRNKDLTTESLRPIYSKLNNFKALQAFKFIKLMQK